MIIDSSDRRRFIGGSDMNYVYGSYGSRSFKDWWGEKVTGVKAYKLGGKYIDTGTLLEASILEELGIDEKYWSIKVIKEGTISGVNTDAFEYDIDDPIIHEVKTAGIEKAGKWMMGYSLPIGYRRQVYHAMWVCGCRRGKIHVLGIKDDEYDNPFAIDMDSRIYSFDLSIDDFDIGEHVMRIGFLTECFNDHIIPTDEQYKIYRAGS